MESNVSKQPKCFILKVICFFLLFLFLFYTASILFKPTTRYRRIIAGFYSEPKDTLDMVYIGPSSVYKYWMPLKAYEELGFTSYTYSVGSMPSALIPVIIQAMPKYQSPKAIVVDIRGLVRDCIRKPKIEFYRRVIDSIPYDITRVKMIDYSLATTIPNENRNELLFDFSMYHTRWDEISDRSFAYAFQPIRVETKGYERFGMNNEVFVYQDLYLFSDTQERKELTPQIATVLRDIIQAAKEAPCEVLFVNSPYNQNDTEHALLNTMGDYITSQGFEFINCNSLFDEMGLNISTDFYDANHTNVYGDQKFTAYMMKEFDERFDLPDHRGDAAYASWDALLPGFHAMIEEDKLVMDAEIAKYTSESGDAQ